MKWKLAFKKIRRNSDREIFFVLRTRKSWIIEEKKKWREAKLSKLTQWLQQLN